MTWSISKEKKKEDLYCHWEYSGAILIDEKLSKSTIWKSIDLRILVYNEKPIIKELGHKKKLARNTLSSKKQLKV